GGGGGMRSRRGRFRWVLFIGAPAMPFFGRRSQKKSASATSMSELDTPAKNGQVAELVIDNETVKGKLKSPTQIGNNPNAPLFRCEVPAGQISSPWYMEWVQKMAVSSGATLKAENNQNLLVNLLLPLVPWLLIFAFIWFFVFRQLR